VDGINIRHSENDEIMCPLWTIRVVPTILVELCCGPYSAGVFDQIQNLPNCSTTPNKMTNEEDVKGLVSLKFLRPWFGPVFMECKESIDSLEVLALSKVYKSGLAGYGRPCAFYIMSDFLLFGY
jgi:hypothetical protein